MSEESAERAAPLSPEERAERVRLAKERAAAARAARESGGAAPSPAVAAATAADTPAAPAASAGAPPPAAAAAPPAERAAPATPEERAAAIEAAKQRAAAARVARESGAPAPAAQPAAAKPALSPEERAAALAQAQERAAAIRAQREAAAPAVAVAAPPAPPATWRIGPGGARVQVLAARPDARAQEAASIDAPTRMVLRRRDFLRGGFWSGLAVLTVGGLATFLDFFNPRDIKGFGGIVTIPSVDVPKPGDDPFHYLEGKTWLVNLKPGEGVPQEFTSFAAPSKDGGLLALYHKCVHLGCTVPWRPDFVFGGVTGWFRCPCHGSTYTKGGVRVFGPAPYSLNSFQITKVDANGVTVNTGKIISGSTNNDPQHTVDAGPFK
jgi:cytochrome b6-f complex iron-sulfur subunit